MSCRYEDEDRNCKYTRNPCEPYKSTDKGVVSCIPYECELSKNVFNLNPLKIRKRVQNDQKTIIRSVKRNP